MARKGLRELDLKGKRVLLRAEFNVPMKDGKIINDVRIRAELSTIRYILDQGAGIIIMTHLGRPKGKPVPEMSVELVAGYLLTARKKASGRQRPGWNPARWPFWRISAFGPRKKKTTGISAVSWPLWVKSI